MANPTDRTQVAVIGAGPGGYAAAFMAADLGLKVTLIDPEENPGGVCLYRGCIPTKALLHVCSVINEAKNAGRFGLQFAPPQIDLEKVRSWKQSVIKGLTGGLGQLVRLRKITHLRGLARFKDAHSLEITTHDGRGLELGFEHAIIATGAKPSELKGVSFDSPHVWDSTKALDLKEIPERLLTVGAGYIGLELSSVYAVLGSRITLVEALPGIMPGADRDMMREYVKATQGLFEAVLPGTRAHLTPVAEGVRAQFEGDHRQGEEALFDAALICVGRKPVTASLGLENAGIALDDKGYIKVDAQRKTNRANIFAIGDVAGGMLLAHKATHEGRVAAEVIAGRNVVFDPKAIPAVEYTDPEIAWCGLTETDARAMGKEIKVAKFPWAASGRAATLGRSEGFTKLILDPKTEQVLGVGIIGVNAGELISEGALAIEMAAVAKDLALTIHPHPTLSETLMEAAEAFYGEPTHLFVKPR